MLKYDLKVIKKTIKKKIAVYDPLDFRQTYKKFVRYLQDEVSTQDISMDERLKHFLIKTAYFALEKRCILYRLMKELNISNPNDIRLLEIAEFIMEKIERDDLARLKKFKEESKFKTFLNTVVTRLLNDFWREKYRNQKHFTKYEPEFLELSDRPQEDPLRNLIKLDNDEMKEKAAEFLPHILDTLDYKEKLAVQLKYEHDMKLSEIARTLNRTRYKTGQFIDEIQRKISDYVLSEIEKGGYNETPGR